ncbi:hypothetical protein [Candidatus Marithrix sp. Canyon 246]|uniref:hypothetical protein n=1 Tax=Candidatus Marithrix sp. Canyon 246 TaxID=1827136 RepID=UPI00084A1535|nr:hypothetical protein [Candidatus Marithrix sp. Canyon 246]
MDNEIENLIKSERGVALLGIATHQAQSSAITECISDEEIVSFVSHNVTKKQRQKIFAHLNRCSKCYNSWLETASCVMPEPSSTRNRWWNFQIPMWQQPLITTSVAVMVLIVAVINFLPSTNSIIQDKEIFNLGFNDEDHSSASQAFKAGINGQEASSTIEYELGRWFLLLKQVKIDSVTNDFWVKQVKQLQKFETSKYSSNDEMKKAMMDALTIIKPLLLELQDDPNNPYKTEQLAEQLEIFMAGIADF